jgi:hypothetical protein
MRRVAIVALTALLGFACTVAAQAPSKEILRNPDAVEAFGCEVCRVFCIEYQAKIEEKQGDDPFEIAVAWARGNTSNYRWDEEHLALRPPGQSIGERVIDRIYRRLDEHVLTDYNERVILHALHAAGHVQSPPKMNWHFCRRHLCDRHLGHCQPDPDKRPYGEMTKAYEHFVELFDESHADPQLRHNRRDHNRAHDVHMSRIKQRHVDPATGEYDPASLPDEVKMRITEEMIGARDPENWPEDEL